LRSGGGNCKVAPWQPTNWPVSTEVGWGSSSVSGWLAGWMPDRRTHRPIEPENRRAVEPKNQSGDVRRILEFESLPTGSRWSCSRSRRWLRRDRQTSRHESKDPKVKCINWYSYRQVNSTREHDYIFLNLFFWSNFWNTFKRFGILKAKTLKTVFIFETRSKMIAYQIFNLCSLFKKYFS